jgi:hypothetical protein
LATKNYKEYLRVMEKIYSINYQSIEELDKREKIVSEIIHLKSIVNGPEEIEIISQTIINQSLNQEKTNDSMLYYDTFIDNLKIIFKPYIDIIMNKSYFLIVLKCALIFTGMLFINMGQLIYFDHLSGDITIKISIVYVTNILTNLLSTRFIHKFDKIKLMKICSLVCSITCFSLVLFKHNESFIYLGTFVLSFMNILGTIAIIIKMAEDFEIKVKSISVSICVVIGNASFLIFPYLLFIFKNAYLVFGFSSLISFLSLLLNKSPL